MYRPGSAPTRLVGLQGSMENRRFADSGFPMDIPTSSQSSSSMNQLRNTMNENEITQYTSSSHSTDGHKQSQFTDHQPKETPTCPYGCCNTPTIPEYLFHNGLMKGSHYDVVIQAFGKKYKLHKLLLDRSPYFSSLFSWSSNAKASNNHILSNISTTTNGSANLSDSDVDSDSSDTDEDTGYRKVYDLSFEVIDDPSSIQFIQKKKSFELVISRLYGVVNIKEEYKIPYEMIEMGQYLAISDVVCTSTDFIIRNMDMSNLAENLKFAINSDFGSASQRIIENGKGILCSNGWEYGPASWDDIPTTIIAQTVGEDYFFVPTEWDRCIFIIKLIERRLESQSIDNEGSDYDEENDDVAPLRKVLNEKIHYCHISPDKLQELEDYQDINGEHYIDAKVLHTALWQTVRLETMITRADDHPDLDTIITSPVPPTKNHKWFKIPNKDETLSGLPKELDLLLRQSLSTTVNKGVHNNESQSNSLNNQNSKIERAYSWTKIPPFRFSLSFANVSELATDKRVYGKTFWYAGSYWNLYLQKSYIASKSSYQVGVYLHRAHNGSTNANTKSGLVNPDVFADNINHKCSPKKYTKRDMNTSNTYQTPSISRDNAVISDSTVENLGMNMIDMSISEDSIPFKDPLKHTSSKKTNPKQSIINYEDQRDAIKVYFIIFTPSRRSIPTITSFLSVPNDFSKSQSWGWKSNNMCVFKDDGTFADGQDPNLKFMILLGNI